MPDGRRVEELSSAASRLLSAAQAGDADCAAGEADAWLAADPDPSPARAAMEYALAVAHLTRNDLPAAEGAATAWIVTALGVGSAEWQANGLAVRAFSHTAWPAGMRSSLSPVRRSTRHDTSYMTRHLRSIAKGADDEHPEGLGQGPSTGG
jgi:hypothetical protein